MVIDFRRPLEWRRRCCAGIDDHENGDGNHTLNLAASGDESLLGARLRANCDQAGVQAAEEADRPAATRASAPDARSGQCLDLTVADGREWPLPSWH
jgi:hypothetical protein